MTFPHFLRIEESEFFYFKKKYIGSKLLQDFFLKKFWYESNASGLRSNYKSITCSSRRRALIPRMPAKQASDLQANINTKMQKLRPSIFQAILVILSMIGVQLDIFFFSRRCSKTVVPPDSLPETSKNIF